MKISATPMNDQASAISDFYLSDCTATNGKDAPDYQSLVLIKDGCMVDLGSLEQGIQAASPNPGHYITFNQFGFADETSGLSFLSSSTK